MPRSRRSRTLFSASIYRSTTAQLAVFPRAFPSALALVALVASTTAAQSRAAADTPLHLPANRFEFIASGDTQPAAKPLAVHNGGSTRFTGVQLTKLAYASPARGAAWLVASSRQTAVAPDELATIGMLCVDAAGLPVGTYRATAAVRAREVPEPVSVTITLVVKDASTRTRRAAERCGTAPSK